MFRRSENLEQKHLSDISIDHKTMTSERWAIKLIATVWDGVLKLWDIATKQGKTLWRQEAIVGHNKSEINDGGSSFNRKSDHYLQDEVPWFQKKVQELEGYSVIAQKAWVQNASKNYQQVVWQEKMSKGTKSSNRSWSTDFSTWFPKQW